MLNAKRKAQEAGFTLVELVIVILILGILSAVALPRFLDLGKDARKAKAEGVFGAVRSASQIVRAGSLIQNVTTGPVTVDGGTVAAVNGYPAATALGIIAAAGLNATNDKLTVVEDAAATPPSVTITVDGAGTPANCRITYSQATTTEAPVIALSATAC